MPWKPERNTKSYAAKRRSATERGYNYQWQVYARQYRLDHPLCVLCKVRGHVTPAEVVDHIVPHRGDLELFWAVNNHQPLCRQCHDIDKAKIENKYTQLEVRRAWLQYLIDETANPTKERDAHKAKQN